MVRARPAILLVVASLLAACAAPGPASTPGDGATSSAPSTPPSSAAAPSQSLAPEASSEGPGTVPPSATPKPSRSPRPSPSPSDAAAGSAADCSGTDENRSFFADVAAGVDWTVICAVLPNRWFVSSGQFRLARGGRLLIAYKGPGGATLSLSEGAWCTEAGGCVPSGEDLGAAALGPLQGTLIGLEDGGFAVSVDSGETVSWLLETRGVDRATTVKLAAAAVEVAD